jgi:hypothetical protein
MENSMPETPPKGLSLEMLWFIIGQNDRLYQERYDGSKTALINAFAAQQAALDNASKASDAAIKHEHEVIEARISVLNVTQAAVEKRVTSLEVTGGKDHGRREPVSEVIKWIGAILGVVISWVLIHTFGK